MDAFNTFEQYFRQVSDLQRATFETWMSTFPSTQSFGVSNYRDNLNKALDFQENLASNSLELQVQLTRISVDIQKQFLEGYFKMLRSWW
ncbi:MAG: hypothetical protein HXY43_23660 [Fischerella sp.]|jgi:hypothetical protein|uniref:hypothetical protein n=1 Tax=Fischerella sp. TaxID=1191 RepID=UPI00181C77D3|nr:hypothetical protein [Fischerella sp.]NWF62170.1 hypothetical protein [Fischerella sp.]